MRTRLVIGVALVVAAAACVSVIKKNPGSSAGTPSGAGNASAQDPSGLETVRGEVVVLPTGGRGGGDSKGAGASGPTAPLITIRSAGETIQVHAGPPRFHQQIGLSLAKGDQIEVTGKRRGTEGKAILVAQTVKKGDQVFKIRGDNGEKLWQPEKRPPPPLSSIAGEIVSLEPEVTPDMPARERSGMMIALKSKDETIVVQLGPESFRVKEGLILAVGDRVEVSGWRLPGAQVLDAPVMLAGTIKKGKQELRVRDEQRRALWPNE
jgi:hypothetical protein